MNVCRNRIANNEHIDTQQQKTVYRQNGPLILSLALTDGHFYCFKVSFWFVVDLLLIWNCKIKRTFRLEFIQRSKSVVIIIFFFQITRIGNVPCSGCVALYLLIYASCCLDAVLAYSHSLHTSWCCACFNVNRCDSNEAQQNVTTAAKRPKIHCERNSKPQSSA